ncbi:hypothetical protein F5I97DRAFT_1808511 [Phlebopus sp. FC_14]|nr:hypothetical protein F5I97DRAFT_1808511 [Phlebopus sp. FC_14]
MVFAPPSPTTEFSAGDFPQPESPCSSTSSLTSIRFAPPHSPVCSKPDKPPIPSVPKPSFERGRRLRTDRRSVSVSPRPTHHFAPSLPPTTNLLDASDRADLIRRNRKLAKLLGQTPRAEGLTPSEETRLFKRLPPPALTAFLGSNKQRPHRHAVSVSVSVKGPAIKTEPSSPRQIEDSWSPGGRRHSIPLTPSSFTFYLDDEPNGAVVNDHRGLHSLADSQNPRESPTSFIDLSDEEVRDHDVSAISSIDVRMGNSRRFFHHSSSTPSLVESFDTEEQAEAERRRKRDKLAKLHRFLGSRVPPDLVISAVTGSSLEPPAMPDEITRDNWLRGRRVGSVKPVEHFDRGKEELDEREKALNVRRAQKMEKVFGTPPPQTLFHTRQGRSTLAHSQPNSPTAPCTTTPFIFSLDAPTNTRNFNQSAYKGKRTHRPETSDSSKRLLPSDEAEDSPSSSTGLLSGYQSVLAQSSVYLNYQHSLNSLTDIIDRVDVLRVIVPGVLIPFSG